MATINMFAVANISNTVISSDIIVKTHYGSSYNMFQGRNPETDNGREFVHIETDSNWSQLWFRSIDTDQRIIYEDFEDPRDGDSYLDNFYDVIQQEILSNIYEIFGINSDIPYQTAIKKGLIPSDLWVEINIR